MMEGGEKTEAEGEAEQYLKVALAQEAWHWPSQNHRRLRYQAKQKWLAFRRVRPQEAMLGRRTSRAPVQQRTARLRFFGIPRRVKSSPGMAVVGRVLGT